MRRPGRTPLYPSGPRRSWPRSRTIAWIQERFGVERLLPLRRLLHPLGGRHRRRARAGRARAGRIGAPELDVVPLLKSGADLAWAAPTVDCPG